MKFFLDTANIAENKDAAECGLTAGMRHSLDTVWI
jgi:hypothetical protein